MNNVTYLNHNALYECYYYLSMVLMLFHYTMTMKTYSLFLKLSTEDNLTHITCKEEYYSWQNIY